MNGTPPALKVLEAQVASDLSYVDYPDHEWVIQREHGSGSEIRDVVVVGAGMSGLSVAFLLLRARILNIVAIDRSPAGTEGPWLSYARMERLRTPKEMVGPDCGLPSLSFAAWYRASFGEDAWTALGKAPRQTWMSYLAWFRRVASIPVENHVELDRVDPQADGTLALRIVRDGVPDVIHTRKVVLATGFRAAGGGVIPEIVRNALPRASYAHSSEDIDFSRLRGRKVAVLGAGASAFDNAATALESGASEVMLFARRPHIEKRNIKEAREFSTLLRHYADLDDACRWRLMRLATNDNPPPPPDSVARCTRHPNFQLFTGVHWSDLRDEGSQVCFEACDRSFAFDFLILGTGFAVDVSARPELAAIADRIALWRDVYAPPPDAADQTLGRFPYLGTHFQFVEKEPGTAPYLANIHDFGIAAVQSMGPICVGLNGMKIGGPRLVSGISRDLFLADAIAHEEAMIRALAQ